MKARSKSQNANQEKGDYSHTTLICWNLGFRHPELPASSPQTHLDHSRPFYQPARYLRISHRLVHRVHLPLIEIRIKKIPTRQSIIALGFKQVSRERPQRLRCANEDRAGWKRERLFLYLPVSVTAVCP